MAVTLREQSEVSPEELSGGPAGRRIRVARMLVTVPALFVAILPPIADLNATHVTNPLWPSHARLHTVWLVCSNSLIALIAVHVLWRRVREPDPGALRLAIVLVGAVLLGFFVAAAAQSVYGGALTDPNGVALKLGSLDANLAAFLACATSLAGALALAPKPAG